MNMKLAFILLLVAATSLELRAQPFANAKTKINLDISAVDINEKPLSAFIAGEYARLRVRADLGQLPPRASVAIGAKATFNTTILGRPVSYTVNLPAQGAAGSLLNPAVGVEDSGRPLAEQIKDGIYEEIFDLNIPRETPAGSATITISVSGSSLAPLRKTFTLRVVRP